MASSSRLLCPLFFSLTGLLADITALAGRSSALSPPVVFALIAAAPALAAIAAITFADDDFNMRGRNHRGWN